jgi:hypothetical protein
MRDVEHAVADFVFEGMALSSVEGASEEVVDYRFWCFWAVGALVRWRLGDTFQVLVEGTVASAEPHEYCGLSFVH